MKQSYIFLFSQRPASNACPPMLCGVVQRLFFHVLRSTFVVLLLCSSSFANNLAITNVTLEDRNPSANTVVVEFDISWDHSWRKDDGRHDAAWVFVKLLDGNTGTPSYPWLHGKLFTAGTNPNDGTSTGTNNSLDIIIPSDKIGAFIRRKSTGTGTVSSKNVRLVVDYGTAGATDTDLITARVYGIEMVYIPEGPFYIGGDNPDLNEVVGSGYASVDAYLSVFNSSGTFQWSRRWGGTAADSSQGVDVDGSFSIVQSGSINGNADLNGDGDTADSNEAGNTGVYAAADGFITKFNSSGTFQWSKRLGGTNGSTESVTNVKTDSSSNVIAVGRVIGTGDLNGDGDTADSNETGETGVYGSTDLFIAKFDSGGTFQWSKRLGGTSNGGDTVIQLAIDSSANIYVGGNVTSNADLNGDGDTGDSGETGGGIYNGTDPFVSAFDSAGTFQWAKRLGGTSGDGATGVAVAPNSNVVLTGTANGNMDFNGDGDTGDTNETGITGVYASSDIFISVFNSAGTFQWSKRLGGTTSDTGGSVAIDQNGNIILTAAMGGNADLNGDADTGDSGETSGGIYSSNDTSISVFNSAGTFQWAKRLGGTASDSSPGVTVDASGNIFVTGSLGGIADLNGNGDTGDSNENNTGYGGTDAFISVFNSSGTFQWSKRFGGTAADAGAAIAVGGNYNIFVGGTVTTAADLNADAAFTSEYGFYQSGAEDQAVQITTTAKSIAVDINSNDDIDTSAIAVTGNAGIAGNTSWPEGYNDFYLMKYEITQQQYRDFLNTLDRTQQGKRVQVDVSGDTVTNYYVMSDSTSISGRQGIRAPASGNGTTNPITFGNDFNANGTFNETDDGGNIAMNWINWPDLAAYADWAGLRPMTELEYEKACRGPGSAVYGEKCWSGASTTSLALTQVTSISNSGTNTETAGNAGGGLVVYNNHASVQGPLRVGFAATSATNRVSAGAGYYGNLGLSGNLQERTVSLGNSTGRGFTGTHGNGVLTTTASFEGNATNNDWPGINGTTNKGVTAGTGMGWRGGGWADAASVLYVSDRNTATGTSTTRTTGGGGRCARTAP